MSGRPIRFSSMASVPELYRDFAQGYSYPSKANFIWEVIPLRENAIRTALDSHLASPVIVESTLPLAAHLLNQQAVTSNPYRIFAVTYLFSFKPGEASEKCALYWNGNENEPPSSPRGIRLFLNVGSTSMGTVLSVLYGAH